MTVEKLVYNPSSKATEKRERTIRERFREFGCSERFDLLDVVDSKQVVLACRSCGNEFVRETSFLKPNKRATSNVGCEKCGIHADGSYTSPRSENKRGMDDQDLVDYYLEGNSARVTAAHFGVNLRRVTRAVVAAGVCRQGEGTDVPDDYPTELTGDAFQDEAFTCAECGRVFTRHQYELFMKRKNRAFKMPKYCSKTCRRKAFMRGYKHGARAKRKQLESSAKIETVPLSELIERDGGVCQLCGKPVDKSDCFYDHDGNFHTGKLYPTADHIVPLAKGGATTWDNVQLAHFHCNSAKRDSVA